MGQSQAPIAEVQLDPFVPWEASVVLCLPEHGDRIREALQNAHNGIAEYAKTSRQKPVGTEVDQILLDSPIAWGNVFYVLAVGRGTKEGLPHDAIPGLLAILRGMKPTSRYLAEAAMLSLARLYSGTKDAMISERIIELWENHEISNVRDCANLAMGMIDNEDVRMYIQAMGDISKVGDSHEVWRYCKNVELMPNAQIDWGSFDERLSCVNPMRDRIFILIRLKNTPTKNVGDDKTKSFVFENLLEIVLLNVVDDRLVLQAALAVVSAHAEYVKTQQRLLEDILGAVQDIRQMNAFREARKAAEALLKEFKDPFTRVFELFPASPDTLERKALREKLTSKFSEFSSLPRSPLEVLLGPEYEGKFDLLVEDIKHPNPSTELSEKNTKI
jgi:hypothetical protein